MHIDRKHALAAFRDYTAAYDPANPRIALKIAHTYRVARMAEEIAAACHMGKEDQDLAWLCGLLHDVGRFEQVRRYDTFSDAKSVSHAELGAHVFFGDALDGQGGTIRSYVEDTDEDQLLRDAVFWHSALALPAGMDERTRTFCGILRDADKIDILKVNYLESPESNYGISEAALRASAVTPEVVDTFYAHQIVPFSIRHEPADMLVGHICFVWDLSQRASIEAMVKEGYLFWMLAYPFTNEETARTFQKMDQHVRGWLKAQGLEVPSPSV